MQAGVSPSVRSCRIFWGQGRVDPGKGAGSCTARLARVCIDSFQCFPEVCAGRLGGKVDCLRLGVEPDALV
eukprot:7052716-Pyramimonas_sp.AAC.1